MKKSNVCTNESVDIRLSAKTKFNKLLKPSLVALAVAQSFSLTSTQAATIYVGGANGAGCGLSAAILSANNDVSHPGSSCVTGSGDDVIELNRDVVISKSWNDDVNGVKIDTYTAMPLITSNLTINGNGYSLSRSSSAPEFNLLEAQGTSTNLVSLTLNNLTLTGGKAERVSAVRGGNGGLYLNEVSILNNETTSFSEGAAVLGLVAITNSIINDNIGDYAISGDVTLSNSTISGNSGTAIFTSDGTIINSDISNNDRGIYFLGDDLTITDSSISNNTQQAIYGLSFTGSLTVVNSQLDHNGESGILAPIQGSGGGGISTVRIEDSSISYNGSTAVSLDNSFKIEILNSQINNNSATVCAGLQVALEAYSFRGSSSQVDIIETTMSNNTAELWGGAICGISGEHYAVSYPIITIKDSSLTGNIAGGSGGAIFAGGAISSFYGAVTKPLTIVNSTISGNTAGDSGGGIYLSSGIYYGGSSGGPINPPARAHKLILENTTIVDNYADMNGGGISSAEAYLDITNSIIAGNSAIVSGSEISHIATPNFTGDRNPISSDNNVLGSSLISNFQAFTDFIPSATDITATFDGTSPTLFDSIVDPLQDNGGATQTHALPLGSPAIDAGDLDTCLNDPVNGLDQRGEVRGNLGLCDIGAYEDQTMTGQLPSISIDSVEVSEGDSTATLTISLSSPQTERIPVDYQTVDGTATEGLDYTGRLGTMTFAPGQTQKIRVIQINDDDLSEATETFSLLLSNPVGASLSEAVGEVTIIDDDGLPTISIEPADHTVNEGDSGNSRRVRYTITLSSAQTDTVSIDYQTMDETAIGGVDYEARFGTMTFAPGQTSKIRSIKVLGDTQPELDETFKLVLSNPSSNAALDVDEADSIGTILDDDGLPTISIEPADHSVNEGDSGNNRRVSYTIKLSAAQTEKVSVDYQTMDASAVGGVDYEIRSGSMTFSPGQTSKIRTVKVLGDTQVEADETFKLVFSNPSSNAALDIDEADSIGTILNDD